MRTINKNVRISHMNNLEWKNELNIFLMNYRSTAHSTHKKSPYEILFKTKMRNRLPLQQNTPDNDDIEKSDF